MILISIICVSKNCANLVEKTISSIAMQKFSNYEIIFIDNLSTDDTVNNISNICKKNKIKDYKIISEEDDGIADAMNKGSILSKGKILNFLHFGDFYSNINVLNIVSNEYKKNKFQIFSGGAVFNYGSTKAFESYPKNIKKIFFANTFPHMAVFLTSETIKLLRGYDKNYKIVMDYDLWFRAYINNVKFNYSKKIFVNLAPSGLSGNIKNVIIEFFKCKINHFKITKSIYYKFKIILSFFVILMKVILYVFKN